MLNPYLTETQIKQIIADEFAKERTRQKKKPSSPKKKDPSVLHPELNTQVVIPKHMQPVKTTLDLGTSWMSQPATPSGGTLNGKPLPSRQGNSASHPKKSQSNQTSATQSSKASGLTDRDKMWNTIAYLQKTGLIGPEKAAQMRMAAPNLSLFDRAGGLWDTLFGSSGETNEKAATIVHDATEYTLRNARKGPDPLRNAIGASVSGDDFNSKLNRATIHNLNPLEMIGFFAKLTHGRSDGKARWSRATTHS